MTEPDRYRRVWLNAASADFAEFRRQVEQTTTLVDWPHADAVEQNALVYTGEAVRCAYADARLKRSLMAEWVEVLSTGPGVLLITSALSDLSTIDEATALFNELIDEQRNSNETGGDHFAKPGANDRVWNSLEKHCLLKPENFAAYYANEALALVSEAWLGRGYQITAQVNRVNPGGEAQSAHRDYHLGFMTPRQMECYPAHVHSLSPVLTLQGAVAHCDMPLVSGPTMYLPYSQQFIAGYISYSQDEYQSWFNDHRSQLVLKKGDAVFFNPALMHAAGANMTKDVYRMANLLQVSSAFGRAMETVNRQRMLNRLYPVLLEFKKRRILTKNQIDCVVAASAEGYPFPTNLDLDRPISGLAPTTQAQLLTDALADDISVSSFLNTMREYAQRREFTG